MMGIKDVFGFGPETRSYGTFLQEMLGMQQTLSALNAKYEMLLDPDMSRMKLYFYPKDKGSVEVDINERILEIIKKAMLEDIAAEIKITKSRMDARIHKESHARK